MKSPTCATLVGPVVAAGGAGLTDGVAGLLRAGFGEGESLGFRPGAVAGSFSAGENGWSLITGLGVDCFAAAGVGAAAFLFGTGFNIGFGAGFGPSFSFGNGFAKTRTTGVGVGLGVGLAFGVGG
jgi:hypothetical protein